MKSVKTTAQFLMVPLFLELITYLFRSNIYPAYLPVLPKIAVIAITLFYFGALYLLLSLILGSLFHLLSWKPQQILVPALFGLFLSLTLARMLPRDAGPSPARLFAFAGSLLTTGAFFWLLRTRAFTRRRLLGTISLFTIVATFCLSKLFRFPMLTPAMAYFMLTGLFALLLFLPLRTIAICAIALFTIKMLGYSSPAPIVSNHPLPPYNRVIFIGIDGLSPEIAFPLAREGKLPSMARMMNEGAFGTLTTLRIPFSPLVWNTIYTGASPAEHGIMSFTFTSVVPGPSFLSLWLDNWCNSDWTHGIVHALSKAGIVRTERPALSRDRLEPTLWNIADQNGLNSIVIGGWTTYPPEQIRGTYISDFALHQGVVDPGSYYPPSKAITQQLSSNMDVSSWPAEIQRYVAKDEKAHLISKQLIATASSQTHFCTVYYCSVDAFGHHYGTNIEMKTTAESDRARMKMWREQIYRRIDAFLQDYINMMDDRTLLIVCSDHGFRFDKRQHNYPIDGIFLMYGKGVAAKQNVHVNVYSLAPTITYALGLAPSSVFHVPPVREAFDGRIRELPARKYMRSNSFYEVTNTKEFEKEKMNELQDLQYINR